MVFLPFVARMLAKARRHGQPFPHARRSFRQGLEVWAEPAAPGIGGE